MITVKEVKKGKVISKTLESRNPVYKNMVEFFNTVFSLYDEGYRMDKRRHSPWFMPLRLVMVKTLTTKELVELDKKATKVSKVPKGKVPKDKAPKEPEVKAPKDKAPKDKALKANEVQVTQESKTKDK